MSGAAPSRAPCWVASALAVGFLVATAGGASRPAAAALAAVLVGAALALPAAAAPLRPASRALSGFVALPILAGVLHLVPLPEVVRSVLAPGPTRVRADLPSLGLGGSWAPLTADVGGTVAELLVWAGAAGLLVLCSRPGAARWAAVLAGLLVVAQVAALVDRLVGTRWLPVPDLPDPWGQGQDALRRETFSGWLLNRNHFAALGATLLPLVVARAVLGGGRVPRGAASLAAVAVAASVVATRSRAGLGAISIEAALLLAWGLRRLGRRRPAVAAAAAVGAVVAAAGLLAAYLGRFTSDDVLARGAVYESALRMTLESPWVGWGLGAFGAAFIPFTPDAVPAPNWYQHAHMDPLQALAETGLFGAAAVLLLAAHVLRSLSRRDVPGPARLLWGLSVAGIALVSLVELPLQIPALRWIWLGVVFLGPAALAPAGSPRSLPSTPVDPDGRTVFGGASDHTTQIIEQ